MKIAIASAELFPFAKVGGLADAVSSLASSLAKRGNEVYTFLPGFKFINGDERFLKKDNYEITIIKKNDNLKHLFVKHNYYDREGVYGEKGVEYPDNFERFTFFSEILIEISYELNVDVIHLNDWHTAYASLYSLKKFNKKIPVLYTIHNLAYQGIYPLEYGERCKLGKDAFIPYLHNNMINFMKIGILTADAVNTVSKKYAEEIMTKEFGAGLEDVLIHRKDRLFGIINGIDEDVWRVKDILERKGDYKKELQRFVGLNERDVPVFGLVSRLADQKGFDILIKCLYDFLKEDIQFVLLGTGDPRYHEEFLKVQEKYRDKVSINLKFDEELALKIYRGSDFFLMPSRFEPCGLGQMISLVNGTIPIVRKTGGLADTVRDLEYENDGNGIVFVEYSEKELLNAIKRGIKLYKDKDMMNLLRRRGVESDFSWNRSAGEYEKLYNLIRNKS
uniref:Glycogen synthase n=1 Tax=candidate division WOR-3 bacterium TaxID=2052148 RepID=A0A7C4YFH1_UNCW3